MAERANPRFDSISSDQGIPVQFVDREVPMLHGRQDCRQPDVLHMGIRPELQSVKTHRHAPGYTAAHRAGPKVGDFEAPIIDLIAAAARKSGRMELPIWQGEVPPRIPPPALESPPCELPV